VNATLPNDIRDLLDQLDAAERDAQAIVIGLSEEQGTWRPAPSSWSIAECLDHLATANRVYLRAMQAPAERARTLGRLRRRPARPGWLGQCFVDMIEPPPKWWSKLKAPRVIRPRPSPPLAGTAAAFLAGQAEARSFLVANADLDLAAIRFPNPFVAGIRFSLATGLHVIPAHERRHLLQARRVRQAMERA
jgi:DinB superfamily